MSPELNYDYILGPHSIHEAINNNMRSNSVLLGTRDSLIEWREKYENFEGLSFEEHTSENYSNLVNKVCGDGKKLTRANSVLLKTSQIPHELKDLYSRLKNHRELFIVALDGVTDIHNCAAILRTCAFYGVDALVIKRKMDLGWGANFFKVASGAYEHVPVYKTSALPKFIRSIKEFGVTCVGLSEKGEKFPTEGKRENSLCLVVGDEGQGISHGVTRCLDNLFALDGKNKFEVLNASVATAIAIERIK